MSPLTIRCQHCCRAVTIAMLLGLFSLGCGGRPPAQVDEEDNAPAPPMPQRKATNKAGDGNPQEHLPGLEILYPNSLKIGVVGTFGEKETPFNFRVRAILNKNEMVIGYAATDDPILVRNFSTDGLVDRAMLSSLPGVWRVSGTSRVAGFGTIFVVEPVK